MVALTSHPRLRAAVNRRLPFLALGCVLSACAVGRILFDQIPRGRTITRMARTRRRRARQAARRKTSSQAPRSPPMVDALQVSPGRRRHQGGDRQQPRPSGRAGQSASEQDLLRSGYGIFYPSIGASFDPTRQKYSPQRSARVGGKHLQPVHAIGERQLCADIFGGERRTVEGLAAQTDLQRDTELATYLTLSSTSSTPWLRRRHMAPRLRRPAIDRSGEEPGPPGRDSGAGRHGAVFDVLSLLSQLTATKRPIPRSSRS